MLPDVLLGKQSVHLGILLDRFGSHRVRGRARYRCVHCLIEPVQGSLGTCLLGTPLAMRSRASALAHSAFWSYPESELADALQTSKMRLPSAVECNR